MTRYTSFPDLFPKPVLARFDPPDSSSDGGAVLLNALDSFEAIVALESLSENR